MSTLHFTATQDYANKVAQLTGSRNRIHYVGAPSMDGLRDLPAYSVAEMKKRFGMNFEVPTILVTFHPETVASEKNETYGHELCSALDWLSTKYQIVITMPNADTMGSVLRRQFTTLAKANERVVSIENFGKIGYFSAMRHCAFLLGNTSSGVIEAASFGKYALDLGERQKGRAVSGNLKRVAVAKCNILAAVRELEALGLSYSGGNVYVKEGRAANEIITHLKMAKPFLVKSGN